MAYKDSATDALTLIWPRMYGWINEWINEFSLTFDGLTRDSKERGKKEKGKKGKRKEGKNPRKDRQKLPDKMRRSENPYR